MDKIFLAGLRMDAMIGIYPEERNSRRPVRIDVEMGVPGDRVFRTGDVADTIDYKEVSQRIRLEAERVRFGLLEEMSEAIASILLGEFGAPWARVTIVKLGVLGDGVSVGVSIERRAPKTAAARIAPRGRPAPVGPDYRMLMSGRFTDADTASQQSLAAAAVRAPS